MAPEEGGPLEEVASVQTKILAILKRRSLSSHLRCQRVCDINYFLIPKPDWSCQNDF